MSIYRELSYDQEIDTVRGIQFGLLSADEITRRSVVEVVNTGSYEGSQPVLGGLFDPRMGVLEHHHICATCEQTNVFCPGHFGRITLVRPVFHPMFFNQTKKVLRSVCFRCSRALITPDGANADLQPEVKRIMAMKSMHKRFDAATKLIAGKTSIKHCGADAGPDSDEGCGAMQPSRYEKRDPMKIVAVWNEGGGEDGREKMEREMTPEEVLRVFQRIREQDAAMLGFNPQWNRPESMILTVLPVPPPSVRPSILEENGQRREDDLTHKLSDIVKTNNLLKAKVEKGATDTQISLLTSALQYHVATFINNQIPGVSAATRRNGQKMKSVADRLKKKEGRVRNNLSGKRVASSARSVITPDPYISLGELGVPVKIATNLTFPEVVNEFNIDEMRKLVRAGPDVWPGARFVRLVAQGATKTLHYGDPRMREEIAERLQPGDIVDRHLRDGDYVLFNRQPSLHKMSMMGHRVRVMPYQSFRISPTVCASYNADRPPVNVGNRQLPIELA